MVTQNMKWFFLNRKIKFVTALDMKQKCLREAAKLRSFSFSGPATKRGRGKGLATKKKNFILLSLIGRTNN